MDKKKGIWILVLVLALTGVACIMIARNNQQPSTGKGKDAPLGKPDSYAEKLYQYHGTYTGVNAREYDLDQTSLLFASLAAASC